MLTTHDIGTLFASMRAIYGHQWAHPSEAIPIWWSALKHFAEAELKQAVVASIERHPNFPPTLPQFLQILKPPPAQRCANTYLPSPVTCTHTVLANRVMVAIIRKTLGVPDDTLTAMIQLKNTLIDDYKAGKCDTQFRDTVYRELNELVACHADAGTF